MNLNKIIKIRNDKRGSLISFEISKFNIFKIKRIFTIDFIRKSRGNHAHIKCSQYFVCIKGKVFVEVISSKNKKKKYLLEENKTKGLLVKPNHWNILSPVIKNSRVICFCDMNYSKSDYITNFKKFIQ